LAERIVQSTYFPSISGELPAVALFSGGIDSAYGLYKLIEAGHDVLYPVTITNNGRVAHLRDGVLRAIMANQSASIAIRPVSTRMHLSHHDRDSLLGISMEESARARAIQFILAGAAFAINCGMNTLHVAENGIGAIGLPMTSDHFGSRATKAMHPSTLSMAADLIEAISERAFTIRNLGFHLTKGQMIAELAGSEGGTEVLAKTSTCDRKVHRGRLSGCGECTSCLSRFAGFIAAGQQDPIHYAVRPTLDPAHASRGGLCLDYQASRFREILDSPEPVRTLVEQFPQARDILSIIESTDTLMSLLKHHSNEISALATVQERATHAA
jgi:7-cyano-7-deazaguanine synthase in queuosine biosynthesis